MLNFYFYKNKIFKISKFLLIFVLITSWMFSGWPQIGNFPPEIQEAMAGTVTYDTAAIHVWHSPVGVTSVDVECWGAGAAGGGGDTNGQPGGGGGGGGAYAKTTGISITEDTDYNVVVGEGGVGAVSSGLVGGDSYFDDGTQLKAKGGTGGLDRGDGGTGGAGGTGSTYNSATYDGGAGADGVDVVGGGGGESAGAASIGTSATGQTGASGVADGGDGGNGGNAGVAGSAGVAPGGAGGGGGQRSGGAEKGGSGAVGKCILTWTTPPSTSIEIKAQDYSTAVTTITFPVANHSTTVCVPYNNHDTASSPQAFGGGKKPVVTLVNTAAVAYNVWYNITAFSNSVVSTEHYVIVAKGGACADAAAIDQTATLDGANYVTTGTVTTIAATGDGAEADERDLYLKISLSAIAGKSGTSTLTILGETP